MSKLSKVLTGIRTANEILHLLDSVVDVDRLIAISNAQGPQAKLIKDAMNEQITAFEHQFPSPSPGRKPKQLPSKSKTKKNSKKA